MANVHAAAMHQFLYPNISVVTNRRHPLIPPEQLFMAPDRSLTERQSGSGLTFVDYHARFVLECFSQLVNELRVWPPGGTVCR